MRAGTDDVSELIGRHIGRVRVEALLGSGGMGAIYRGFDEALERPVALKQLRHAEGMTTLGKNRFLREARMLSRLDHPNVCRIWDLLEVPEGDFLVLELIEGRTLAEVKEEGLDREAKLRILERVAAALEAAHAENIVHRDLKPDNVMIAAGGEVKVLDFGIARPAETADEDADMASGDARLEAAAARSEVGSSIRAAGEDDGRTTLGSIIGTARYMSPEQARGESVTEASDLYSLGILMQEVLTESSPYPVGLTPPQLLVEVSKARTAPVSGLDKGLTRLIEQLKSLDPERRPSAGTVRRTLAAELERPRRLRRRAAFTAAVLVLTVVTAFLTLRLSRPVPLLEPGQRGRLAVAPFFNGTGNAAYDWVELGLASMVAQSLDSAEGIDVVDPEKVKSRAGELDLVPSAELSREALERLARTLAVRILVATTVERAADQLAVRYAIYDAGGSFAVKVLRGVEPTDLANELRRRIAGRLRPTGEWNDLRDTFSGDVFANHAFAMGVQRLATGGPKAGEAYFRVALDRDPAFLRARLQLGVCRNRAGETADAEGIFEEALAAARESEDPEMEARALVQLGHLALASTTYPRAREHLDAALAIQEEIGDRAGMYGTLYGLGVMAFRQGNLDDAAARWTRGKELAVEAGDRAMESSLQRNLAYILLRRGDHAGAGELFEESLAASRAIEDRQLEAFALGSLGFLSVELGQFEKAEGHFSQARKICVGMGDLRCQLSGLINLGSATFHLGKLTEAETWTREALDVARQVEDRRAETQCLASLGYFASLKGRLDEAESFLDEAQRIVEETRDPETDFLAQRNLAYLRIRQGRLEAAGKHLEAALAHKRDKLALVAAARYHYARGDLEQAYATQLEARDSPGLGWTRSDEARLETYGRAREIGRRLPLEDEGGGD